MGDTIVTIGFYILPFTSSAPRLSELLSVTPFFSVGVFGEYLAEDEEGDGSNLYARGSGGGGGSGRVGAGLRVRCRRHFEPLNGKRPHSTPAEKTSGTPPTNILRLCAWWCYMSRSRTRACTSKNNVFPFFLVLSQKILPQKRSEKT